MTIRHDHKFWHSSLISSFISVVVANSQFILQIYSLPFPWFYIPDIKWLADFNRICTHKKDKIFYFMEFTLLPFLKPPTTAPSTDKDSFTCAEILEINGRLCLH